MVIILILLRLLADLIIYDKVFKLGYGKFLMNVSYYYYCGYFSFLSVFWIC